MQMTRRTRLWLWLNNLVLAAAFLAVLVLIAWLSTRYVFEADWSGARPVVYMASHGERDLQGQSERDLGGFGGYLAEWGHRLEPLRVPDDGIPEEATLLVVAGPRGDWTEPARDAVTDWLNNGGNLLWLVDDGDDRRLDFLADALHIDILPGTLIDAEAEQQLDLDEQQRPLVLNVQSRHPALQRVEGESLFINARALELTDLQPEDWEVSQLLHSQQRHELVQDNDPDAADAAEPPGGYVLGLSFSRSLADGNQQRVAVVGDADFLSNAHFRQGQNPDLGLHLVNWLSAGSAADQSLDLNRGQMVAMGVGFLLVLPGLWLLGAGWAWWRRRWG